MIIILSTTIISCHQLFGIVNRIQQVLSLTSQQKNELIWELKKVVPSCPIKVIEKNE